jgi:hypothetical protein
LRSTSPSIFPISSAALERVQRIWLICTMRRVPELY